MIFFYLLKRQENEIKGQKKGINPKGQLMGKNLSKDENFQNIFIRQRADERAITNPAEARRLQLKNLRRTYQ